MGLSETPQKPEGFDGKIENLKYMKEHAPHRYHETVQTIKDMAQGDDPEEVRQYYPGWEKEDFEDLLRELGEAQTKKV